MNAVPKVESKELASYILKFYVLSILLATSKMHYCYYST